MRIPHDKLSEGVLVSVIESFVLREGTDYGASEVSLGAKVAQVRRQLEKGEVCVVFDAESESVAIMSARDLPKER